MNLQEENKFPEQTKGTISEQPAVIKKDHYMIWFWANVVIAILGIVFEYLTWNIAHICQLSIYLSAALLLGLLGTIISIVCIALKSAHKNKIKMGISIFLFVANILNLIFLVVAILFTLLGPAQHC